MPNPRPDPPRLTTIASQQCGLVTHDQARSCGMTKSAVARRVRDGHWERFAPGIYVLHPGIEPPTLRDRQRRGVESALLRGGPGATAVGLAALLLHGNTGLPARWTPRVVLESGTARGVGIGRHVCQHANFERATALGRPAATVPHAIIQSLPDLDRLGLLAILDSALHRGQLGNRDELLRLAAGRRGARLLRAMITLADGLSESYLETWARLQCIDAGIAPDAIQLEFRDGGVVLARADLAWRLPGGRWLLVELDGVSVHGTPEAAYRDRARSNALLAGSGAVMLRFTARDLARPGYVPSSIKAVLARLST